MALSSETALGVACVYTTSLPVLYHAGSGRHLYGNDVHEKIMSTDMFVHVSRNKVGRKKGREKSKVNKDKVKKAFK